MVIVDDGIGQTRRLLTEEEDITVTVVHLGEGLIRVGRERNDPTLAEVVPQIRQRRMDRDVGQIVVVQSRATQLGIGEVEAQGLDEVEVGTVTAANRMALPVLPGISGVWKTMSMFI